MSAFFQAGARLRRMNQKREISISGASYLGATDARWQPRLRCDDDTDARSGQHAETQPRHDLRLPTMKFSAPIGPWAGRRIAILANNYLNRDRLMNTLAPAGNLGDFR
jgi:hypothetical protein